MRSLEPNELRRALQVATGCFVSQLREAEPKLAARLEASLLELARG